MLEITTPEPRHQLVSGLVAVLSNPQCAQVCLRVVNSIFSEEKFVTEHAAMSIDHLKRIRKATTAAPSEQKLELLLFGSETAISDEIVDKVSQLLESKVKEALSQQSKWGEGSVTFEYKVVPLPDKADRDSPASWMECNAVWPLSVPKPSEPAVVTREEVKRVKEVFLEQVLPISRHCARSGFLPIAAVIVDPSTGKVVATSKACASMTRGNPSACTPYGYAADHTTFSPSLVLEHPVMHALKKLSEDNKSAVDAEADSRKRSREKEEGGVGSQTYLANDLHLYVTHEPCVMCAMALVHSRIKTVFFAFENKTSGGLLSCYHLHTLSSLNHHFQSFYCEEAGASVREAWKEEFPLLPLSQ
ncbi:Cytidine and deoxycytidylate deaminase zinc-binding region/MafB19-like deaminase, putative [Angomonas deanei]|uniref:Cytidine and deoxycytidylate deaminase zinc-binding region/MafB19-like deaminase, putative n=1 Tax=Angomonas deanei TaxID=59799 RepID=A0A7G2CAW0_9TRYP|nr:Cytidine and deoxycytidylate deaminase zinc-binding region/MafB19-like deaminase, putative [Angomonas deanei]